MKESSLVQIILAAMVGTVLGLTVQYLSFDRNDINRDGVVDIVDLSVLAATINDMRGCEASAYQASHNGFGLEENLAVCNDL